MVSIVVVSHSKRAAEGIRDVAQEMGGDATILPVGGDPDGGIGTTAPAIEEGIREASDGSGVLVIADLGSAVMNAEIAVEAVEGEIEATIADAPILEGTLNAAVSAAQPDASLSEVLERAEEARELRKL
ncbi:dihydroxyacetone kinase phosphoryl donor subunit DhaM [Halobacteriaceae archaeon SHR40]|uniref:dihydroxyacetone kinase phosphoryl donor subunit DhaM n=1 Tax=Halovenus amylolytica TaxID=2500550 RepID=UPI000FE2FE4C